MAAAIPGFSPTTPPSSTTTNTGLNSMSSSDFLNLMITQLQQQDPLNPTSSSDLMSQMAQISQMQSSTTLDSTLTTLNSSLAGQTLQQSISSAAGLIGSQITGVNGSGATVSGNVVGVSVTGQTASLSLNTGDSIAMSSVTAVQLPGSTSPISSSSTSAAASN